MERYFNVTGACESEIHYMVNLLPRLKKIKKLVDRGAYFTINRARQFGKTTTLGAMKNYLQNEYLVVSMDFQMLSHGDFENESAFVSGFCSELLAWISGNELVPISVQQHLKKLAENKKADLGSLFRCISEWCQKSEKPIVLMIDEVDSATNNQIFLDFLAQLRGYYIHRKERPTFQSVILAGVYDVKNIKRKLRPDEEHKVNSPWNIATDFTIDMSFDISEIAGMLKEYESEHSTGMNIQLMAQLLFDYTSGYPFLVSRLCKLIDEEIVGSAGYLDEKNAWTKEGFLEALKCLLSEKNTLFESLIGKLKEYPSLKEMLYAVLFHGKPIVYNPDDEAIDMASMFGFIKNRNGNVVIANRIFEIRLYNMFLATSEAQNTPVYNAALRDKNQFIENGHLNMEKVLRKFVIHFDELYGDQPEKFMEEDGRRYFLLYLRPIINGVGNYYIEARTRNLERTDVIVDYCGEQFIIEMKIWRGNDYNTRGERQLTEYLEHYGLDKGYMLSFNFNKKKEIGVKRISVGEKVLVEAVV